ncbi:MAG: sodium ion-translocating decarboxylase subunit beta [Firmicutes bacterium]|nr:sodium ion-translocating decarboxylase subunit beta [Bacillota bacterium]
MEFLTKFIETTGIMQLFYDSETGAFNTDFYKTLIMYVIVGVLVYFCFVKKYEPILLLHISFGILLGNIP